MSTAVLSNAQQSDAARSSTQRSSWASTLGSTAIAFLLLGYHPYAEDGGIYAAAIAARMDPSLFEKEHAWVEGHTRLTLFVPAVASLFLKLHLTLDAGLMILQIAGLFATLAAVWLLAKQCFGDDRSARVATLIFAVCAGLPVAGTSLYLFDPYVTARTLTTPLLLFATLFVLKQRWIACAVTVTFAAALHPLMTLWGSLVLAFLLVYRSKNRLILSACLSIVVLGTAAAIFVRQTGDSALVHTLALGRAYWFLSQWRWYEIFGALAPCLLLAWLARRGGNRSTLPLRQIANASCWVTGTALLVALCFARLAAHTSIIAKYQPLRTLHLVFALFLIAGAGALYRSLPARHRAVLTITLCGGMAPSVFWMQHLVYPASRYIELPGLQSNNDWMQAFRWIRWNTDRNALFAIDADYNSMRGEDAQGFRAVTLRSVLPDRAKDGGIASVVPSLAEDWQHSVTAQQELHTHLNRDREQNLRAMGANWVVVAASTKTGLFCPYRNNTVQVCRLIP